MTGVAASAFALQSSDDGQQSYAGEKSGPYHGDLVTDAWHAKRASRLHSFPAGAGHIDRIELSQQLEQANPVRPREREKRRTDRTGTKTCHRDPGIPGLLHQRL